MFPLEEGSGSFSSELPDSFFDVTINDLKLMLRDLKRNRESMESAPLMTKELRDLEIQNKCRKYTKTVIRIQFPDRYVIQGVFNPNETVADVAGFVRHYLNEPGCDFYFCKYYNFLYLKKLVFVFCFFFVKNLNVV